MTPSDVIRHYYDACTRGEEETARWMHDDCIVDEPTFLPYGRIDVIGVRAMFRHVGGVFFRLFAPDAHLEDTRYFEDGDAVVAVSRWVMTGLHTGRTIDGHYHEYFEVRDGRVALMRPLYHAAGEMIAEMDAARAAGVDLTP